LKKILTSVLVLLCLIALIGNCIKEIKAQPSSYQITINHDGTITPSTAPIQQRSTVYTLTSNIKGWISIEASNITIDGKKTLSQEEYCFKLTQM